MERFVGLWSGPADSSTALGDFPIMTMDARPISDHTLFARGDLDADNSIRFLFDVETIDGEDLFIYRNGGYFAGALRDSRTKIETADPVNGTYRFCAVHGGFCNPNPGCDYIDAVWQFDGDDKVSLDVTVCGQPHVLWQADRIETRDAPAPFPVDLTPQDDGTGPYPDMPSVDVTLGWNDPAPAGAQLILSLSVSPCPLNPLSPCAVSRTFLVILAGGETSTAFTLDQVHPGPYSLNVLFDADANFFPSSGDRISPFNASVTVDAAGDNTINTTVNTPLPF